MYPSTEMLISVQKYKLQYGKISPILSTQITAPVKKISISQYKNISSGTNIFIGCATRFFSTVKFMYTTVQQYLSQYKNINLSTKKKWKEKYNNSTTMCIPVQKCKFQYKNKSFGTEKYFLKNWKKPVGTLYMIITMYLNIYAYYSIPKQTLYTSLL